MCITANRAIADLGVPIQAIYMIYTINKQFCNFSKEWYGAYLGRTEVIK